MITLFFFLNIGSFQSVNKLYSEITSQESWKSMWFVDKQLLDMSLYSSTY